MCLNARRWKRGGRARRRPRHRCQGRRAAGRGAYRTSNRASDGFIEARSAAGVVLGYDGFLAMVARHAAADPAACLAGLFAEIGAFSGDAEEADDRTLVVVRHHAPADLTPGPFPTREGGA